VGSIPIKGMDIHLLCLYVVPVADSATSRSLVQRSLNNSVFGLSNCVWSRNLNNQAA